MLRFGHDRSSGNPREYVDVDSTTLNTEFIGRFTMRETSHLTSVTRGTFPLAATRTIGRQT